MENLPFSNALYLLTVLVMFFFLLQSGNFPPPTNPNEVGARVLMQRRVESLPSKTKEDEGRGEGARTSMLSISRDEPT